MTLPSLEINGFDISRCKPTHNGNHGDVYKGRCEGRKISVKKFTVADPNQWREKISFIAQCRSERTVAPWGIHIESNAFFVIRDWEKYSLYDYLHSDQVIRWERRWQIAIETVEGLVYLHQRGVVHGNLKSPNVMITEFFHAKLADFGYGPVCNEIRQADTRLIKWGDRWKAPEELYRIDAKPDQKSDVYSLGLVLGEIASRFLPFSDVSDEELSAKKIKGLVEEIIPADTPPEYADWTKKCCAYRPEVRPQTQILLEALKNAKPSSPEEEPRLQEERRKIQRVITNTFANTIGDLKASIRSFHPINLETVERRITSFNEGEYIAGLEIPLELMEKDTDLFNRVCVNLTELCIRPPPDIDIAFWQFWKIQPEYSLSGSVLSYLTLLPALTALSLKKVVKDNVLEQLTSLRNLVELDVSCSPFTDKGAAFLPSFSHLSKLCCSGCLNVTNIGFEYLGHLTCLTFLDVSKSKISTVTPFTSLINLTDLNFDTCSSIGSNSLETLCVLPNLTCLNFNGCGEVSAWAVECLKSMTSLKSLTISLEDSEVSQASCRALRVRLVQDYVTYKVTPKSDNDYHMDDGNNFL